MQTELLTPDEVAKILKIKPTTLKKYRCIGGGPRFVKVSRSVRYKKIDVEEFIEARVFDSTSQYLQ